MCKTMVERYHGNLCVRPWLKDTMAT
ncbi:hypothetical protein F383_31904 [Gossypium arboreum]|uniref:Uncharacterized protein n=1 Tax=Gossypium arboreum TaxID=29729 RepID=A0A0B0PLS7_GOSAR|nr:hypothetical protein F383_31904 [Gossypium arboreum]